MSQRWDDWGEATINDFIYGFCGAFIDEGASRKVYQHPFQADKVIKVESEGSWQNITEYLHWQRIKDTRWSEWFAPCFFITDLGRVLIQAKTKPVKAVPKMIPYFMIDVRPEQFGKYKGRIVIHDYAILKLNEEGLKKYKLVPGKDETT